MKIGDIVSVLTNPYTDIDIEKMADATDEIVSIQSDSDFIPPFMVVAEVAKIPGKESEKYDIETGFEHVKGYSYKCIYFNSITKTYEEKWFPERFLKNYEIPNAFPEDLDSSINVYLGRQMILKTWKLESAKRKAYLKVDSKSFDSNNHVTTAFLKHLPPLMTVIGFIKSKEGYNKGFDKTTGEDFKKRSLHLIKCQWYNPKTGGFSENVLPLETLSLVKQFDTSLLRIFKDAIIDGNQYFKIRRGSTEVYAKPIRLVFNHCEHILVYEDLISGKTYPIEFTQLPTGLLPENLDLDYAPKLGSGVSPTRENLITSIEDFVSDVAVYYRIKYIDIHQRITVRTISILSIQEVEGKKYIIAECHLRQGAERTFLMDNILQVKKLFPIV